MAMQTIGVAGAGQMGNGIAQVFAQAGYQILMQDITSAFAAKGLATSDATFEAVMELSGDLGKTPIPCNDFPGFSATVCSCP